MNVCLRRARQRARLTQEELANRLGTSVVSIWRWEQGALPSPYYRQQLCAYFGFTANELGWPLPRKGSSGEREVFVDPVITPPMQEIGGREAILATLTASLDRSGGARCVGLTGLPGVGKTAVAQELVTTASLQQAFDGVFWASFEAGSSPEQHLQRWASLLSLGAMPSERAHVQARLQAALGRRRLLVVLDDVHAVEEAFPLLHLGNAQSRVLVLTRQPGVAHRLCQQVISLPDLAATDAFALLTRGLSSVVPEPRLSLSVLMQARRLPLELWFLREQVRQIARQFSDRPLDSIVAYLVARTSPAISGALHASAPWHHCSFAKALQQEEQRLSSPLQASFRLLVSTMREKPFAAEEIRLPFPVASQEVLMVLTDAGLISWLPLVGRYHIHPAVVEYVDLTLLHASRPLASLPAPSERSVAQSD